MILPRFSPKIPSVISPRLFSRIASGVSPKIILNYRWLWPGFFWSFLARLIQRFFECFFFRDSFIDFSRESFNELSWDSLCDFSWNSFWHSFRHVFFSRFTQDFLRRFLLDCFRDSFKGFSQLPSVILPGFSCSYFFHNFFWYFSPEILLIISPGMLMRFLLRFLLGLQNPLRNPSWEFRIPEKFSQGIRYPNNLGFYP